ncbi:fungal-specific transcription factor domain-containing protein [Amylostereum chailletii]|nr:fungal-specific transcription factor domain-containing protein [Amylostereum chailletii]
MNHGYPANGAHYPQPVHGSPYHPPVPSPTNGSPITAGPGIPAQHSPQYAYPVHYSSHPYPAYPYPQQVVVYGGSPRPDVHPSPSAPSSSTPQTSTGKRKRGSGSEGKDDDESEADATPTAAQRAASAAEAKKRTKTQRACDSCRSRKIRCDVLTDTDPPLCHHCKQYGFECTFFLPIAETRFKKKKLEEEAAAEKSRTENDRGQSSTPLGESRSSDVRVMGPTSEAHLLHSSATIPSRLYENYDARHHHTWEVSQAGDGLIQVMEPNTEEVQLALPKPVDMRIERDMIEKLVNAYFSEVAPVLPIITQAEFLASPSPPPILLYSICLVAAARREVPQSVFDSIRYAVNAVIKGEDVLSTASVVNVQSLLILCMVGDCHSQFVPNALSAMWIRLGTAIRMAQDLGLHRAEAVKQNIDMRRRLWCACVISDRWMSLSYGHPHMIDVNDCDTRLPSSDDPHDLYVVELVRLSIILGRVLKTIYSPAGLTLATDEILHQLLSDIESWRANLPEILQFRGPDTSRAGGLLFLLYSCVCMIFWRVFMRISYSCPAHLKFGLKVEQWSTLVKLTGDAIEWLDRHDDLYDVWMFVAYAATSCALVQYHTWARRQDQDAAAKLKTLRDCIRRWDKSLSPDHMSARRKTAEIIALLYEVTQGPPPPMETPALNPTGGVVGKRPPPGGFLYEKDPSRPGGGVFIARPGTAEAYKELPPGTVIEHGSMEESEMDVRRVTSGGTMVNLTPIGRSGAETNVNPAMEGGSGSGRNVQVVNLLQDGSPGPGSLEQLAMADNSWLEGIPGGMFDWGQWDEFFTRIGGGNGGGEGVRTVGHGGLGFGFGR